MIRIEDLYKITNNKGNIFHFLKFNQIKNKSDGEIYFSEVLYNKIKAWKLHNKATLNVTVPIGEVKFVFFDQKNNKFIEKNIGENNYKKIIIPPKIWYGFQGLSSNKSLIASYSDNIFDDNEVNRKEVSELNYDWRIK